jgi:hypothetical protein
VIGHRDIAQVLATENAVGRIVAPRSLGPGSGLADRAARAVRAELSWQDGRGGAHGPGAFRRTGQQIETRRRGEPYDHEADQPANVHVAARGDRLPQMRETQPAVLLVRPAISPSRLRQQIPEQVVRRGCDDLAPRSIRRLRRNLAHRRADDLAIPGSQRRRHRLLNC